MIQSRYRTAVIRALLVLAAACCSLAFSADRRAGGVRHLFDLTGDGKRQLSLPSDVALGRDGRAYVVDGGNNRVAVFDRGGDFLFDFGGEGTSNGRFRSPVGIGIDGQGLVYVADTGNHRVQVFEADGTFRNAFPITDHNLKVRPIDVAPTTAGFYVTGNNNHKVMEYTAAGRRVREWGGTGEEFGFFRFPASLAVAPDGAVYVVDVLNARVQVFTGHGGRLVQVGGWGVLPGQLFRPKGVALDRRRRVYVSDSYLDVIQVYSDEARFVHVLGGSSGLQRFVSVAGIAVGADDRLYAAEMLSNKVSVYQLD